MELVQCYQYTARARAITTAITSYNIIRGRESPSTYRGVTQPSDPVARNNPSEEEDIRDGTVTHIIITKKFEVGESVRADGCPGGLVRLLYRHLQLRELPLEIW